MESKLTNEQLIAYYTVRLHFIGVKKQTPEIIEKCKQILLLTEEPKKLDNK